MTKRAYRGPTILVCDRCRAPITLHTTPPRWLHAEPPADGHPVGLTRSLPASVTACRCCGAEGPGVCPPCRAEHGAKGNLYIASLRCPVREEREIVDSEIAELLAPAAAPAKPKAPRTEAERERAWALVHSFNSEVDGPRM